MQIRVGLGWAPCLIAASLGFSACGDSGGATDGGSSGGATITTGLTTGTATATATATEPTGTDPSMGSMSEAMSTTVTEPTTGTTANPTDATTLTTAGDDTGNTGTTGTTGTTGDTSTSGVIPETGTGTSTGDGSSTGDGTTGEPPPCEPGDGMGGGKVEKSFIWISSFNLNEVSKVDTLTMTELARYKTGPANQNPSRTAVSADGRFVVINNRDGGRSTMVAANEADCVDKNGNGMIDTSQNKGNILGWDADECVRWSVALPFAGNHSAGPRGVTWTPGEWSYEECKYVEPKVWVGYLAAGNVAHFVRIDGNTGTVEETLTAPAWLGNGYAPYGAALDPQFRPWFSSLRGEFVRVNTDQDPVTLTRITPPNNVQSYGFTVDQVGNPWFGGCSGPVTVYDQQTQTFTAIAGTNACHRGMAADEKYVWVASNGPCGIVQIDRKTRTLIKLHNTAPCNTAIGVSIDTEKKVWLVDQGGFAWKFDPENVPGMMKVDVAGSHYVYSDMTGGQLQSVLPQ